MNEGKLFRPFPSGIQIFYVCFPGRDFEHELMLQELTLVQHSFPVGENTVQVRSTRHKLCPSLHLHLMGLYMQMYEEHSRSKVLRKSQAKESSPQN